MLYVTIQLYFYRKHLNFTFVIGELNLNNCDTEHFVEWADYLYILKKVDI